LLAVRLLHRFGALVAVVALVAAFLALPPVARPAHAAPLPGAWCGPGASTADLPDVAVGAQIHILYMYPADGIDRTDFVAPRIARDVAGVGGWWQAQDPTRTPRFDVADFPCDSEFGRLDITTVPIQDAATLAGLDDRTVLLTQLRAQIARALGPAPVGKAYLVYVDVPVPGIGTVCALTRPGSTQPSAANGTAFVFLQPNDAQCLVGGFGTGTGWPAQTVAHELLHVMAGRLVGAPHACVDDPAHVCDPRTDVLAISPVISYSSLGQAVLDGGRDDYYGHGLPNRWDARNSAWLEHLDAPQHAVTVSIAPEGGGRVSSTLPGTDCPPRCSPAWNAETVVELAAVAEPGYAFVNWAGDCQGLASVCSVTANSSKFVLAVFAPVQRFDVRVEGPGVVEIDGADCARRCSEERARGSLVALVARPDPKASFVGWSGRCRDEQRRCVVPVQQRNAVTARFTKLTKRARAE